MSDCTDTILVLEKSLSLFSFAMHPSRSASAFLYDQGESYLLITGLGWSGLVWAGLILSGLQQQRACLQSQKGVWILAYTVREHGLFILMEALRLLDS